MATTLVHALGLFVCEGGEGATSRIKEGDAGKEEVTQGFVV
jgi:hypothetical protein